MSNTVRRWVITDPHDDDPTTNTYLFPRNPATMSSLNAERNVSSLSTTNGVRLLYEGQSPAKAWTFAGPLLDRQQYEDLNSWVYERLSRVVINDHFGRDLTVVLTTFELVPVRRMGYYYSHDYTVSALVLAVGAPTVDNAGPVSV